MAKSPLIGRIFKILDFLSGIWIISKHCKKCQKTKFLYNVSAIQIPTVFMSPVSLVFHTFNSRLNHLLEVAQDWYRSILRIEVTEPYPQSNGGQK